MCNHFNSRENNSEKLQKRIDKKDQNNDLSHNDELRCYIDSKGIVHSKRTECVEANKGYLE